MKVADFDGEICRILNDFKFKVHITVLELQTVQELN